MLTRQRRSFGRPWRGVTLPAVALATATALLQPAAPSRAAPPAEPRMDAASAKIAAEAEKLADTYARGDKIAQRLTRELGNRAGGAYFEPSGALVMTVLDEDAARRARAAGAEAKLVTRSAAELNTIVADLAKNVPVPGRAAGIDTRANQVELTLPIGSQTVAAARATSTVAAATRLAARYGDAVRVTYDQHAKPRMNFSGGDRIWAGRDDRCTAGFNVLSASGGRYFLTAGHCAAFFNYWYFQRELTTALGPTINKSFPGNDYGIARFDASASMSFRGTVGDQDIARHSGAYQGIRVCRRSYSSVKCGYITAVNMSVDGGLGVVHQLSRADACSDDGDSGGPWHSGDIAVGLHSIGRGSCAAGGGYSYMQPVQEALVAYNVRIF